FQLRRRPRSPLFPYTTLFRSGDVVGGGFLGPVVLRDLVADFLPALRRVQDVRVRKLGGGDEGERGGGGGIPVGDGFEHLLLVPRSEERRVGKECGTRSVADNS